MSLYYIFTIDGDWDEYFSTKLSMEERRPGKKTLLSLIKHEIKIARYVRGKMLHFIHTSPVTRKFFIQPELITLWKKIEAGGGSVGVHCHEEDLFNRGKLIDPDAMERSVRSLSEPLRERGLTPISYRGGYLAFCEKVVPILEKNRLLLDFSCSSGRYLHYEGRLIADWRGAPKNYYRICYHDHRKEGDSNVIEIPLGKAKRRALYIDVTPLLDIFLVARHLTKMDKASKKDHVVSLLTHTYEFSSAWKRIRIKLALLICKLFGKFISDKEALDIIEEEKGIKRG